ncbi:MAG: hypothetical protein ACRD0F_08400 [Acidimicrobiales bacterium]
MSDPPWAGGRASKEVCPSCGIQFGYDDAAASGPVERRDAYERWREAWIRGGMQWFSPSRRPPARWDPHAQLRRLEL